MRTLLVFSRGPQSDKAHWMSSSPDTLQELIKPEWLEARPQNQ